MKMGHSRKLDNLFYDDYDNPGMPAIWRTNNYGKPRIITWSLEDKQILFGGIYENVNSQIYNYENKIRYAFSLWDKAIDSIRFKQTRKGNQANITLATSTNTKGNLALFIRKIPSQTGYIEAGRIKLNQDKLSRYTDGVQTKVIIHEIGNILGLGDIKCSPNIRSVQEDQCSPPEPFTGGKSLYNFDIDLIKYVYGESKSQGQDPYRIEGTTGKDKITGTKGSDYILGYGGTDKINGGRGNDLIDAGYWTQGKQDVLKGGGGRDTFVIKDSYYVHIKDFKITEDILDISGLSQGFDWGIRAGNTYIYNSSDYEVAKIKGRIDLNKVETIL